MAQTPQERNAKRRATYAAKNKDLLNATRRAKDAERRSLVTADTGQSEYKVKRKPRLERQARRLGFPTATDLTRSRRLYPGDPVAQQEYRDRLVLRHFQISKMALKRIRRENRNYSDPFEQESIRRMSLSEYRNVQQVKERLNIRTYDLSRDRALDQGLQYEDVGYAIAYNKAVVHTTYEQVKNGRIEADQFFYLVEYGHFYDADTFEERYGFRGVAAAHEASQKRIP